MSVLLFRTVVLVGFGSRPKGGRHSRVLDEELFSLEAGGSRVVRERSLLDMNGRQRPFPTLDDHVEPVGWIGDGSIRGDSGQVAPPDNAGALCVVDELSMPFLDVSWCPHGFCMSLVAEVSVVSFLSRDVSHVKMLMSVLRRMHGTDAPKVASADHTSDDSSSFDLLSSEFGNVQAESKTHVADPSPGLGGHR